MRVRGSCGLLYKMVGSGILVLDAEGSRALGRLFVFTLGFHWDFAMKRLTSSHAGRDDAIMAFTAMPPAPAVRTAYSSLSETVRRYIGAGMLGLHEVDLEDGLDSAGLQVLRALSRALGGCRYSRVIADLSGGSRGVHQSVSLALSLLRGVHVDVYVQSDTGGSWELLLPGKIMELISPSLPRDLEDTLKALASLGGSAAPHMLAGTLGVTAKTVTNRFYRLRGMGLAAKKGRSGSIHLTGWGLLLGEALLLADKLASCRI